MLLLSNVTDEQLLASQIVKTALLCIVAAGIIYNIYRIIRAKDKRKRIAFGVLLAVLGVVLYFTTKEYVVESSLLSNVKYAKGVTIGYCNVTGMGEGIVFEYKAEGKIYRCCNTFYPISKDSIQVPGGEYMVRYSEKYISEGRMNFNSKAENK